MELAKITSKGQITIPIQIRKMLNLKDGDKVVFMTEGGRVIMENPTRLAVKEAQEAFEGLAEELGLKSEDDVINLVKEVRKELWEKKHADND
ncbi:transcriptional regulator, AbrB family [Syntrophobotulus glycolicus DSM 8271]|uniref:Transcriptional regulator, AbrB family n=1 Tax=Syntrophobotulus glycolicus (strain DSM 8271 / FlGlyR) TaxID=645991 RepID=F0SVC2_SYNGF|nr:AbrB/MazE/SpoVT family DNA-binding domain-containing protein [Syntrophobotulus glycolicus]ADY56695.1 transcriptional regulator, AbrB family [Syntrophobotulus glycolicus DSM 8271]